MEREGFSCGACYNPRKALEMMKEGQFDLVILDITMPGMDGYELARRIRAFSNVPLIFLSAKDEEVDSVLGFAVGADDYVTKPFCPRELGMRVRACLRRALAPSSLVPSGLLSMRGIEYGHGACAPCAPEACGHRFVVRFHRHGVGRGLSHECRIAAA